MTHVDMRFGRAVRWVATGAAGAVFLTACGAADGNTTSDDEGPATTSSSFVSPLGEFLNPGGGSGDEAVAAGQAKEKKVQESAAACMTEQGFDYVPFVYPSQGFTPTDDLDYSSRAYAEKYGYGISTMAFAASSSAASTVIDPNQSIVEAMSEGEREAYYIALWGGGMSVMEEAPPSSEAAPTEDAATTDAVTTDAVTTAATTESAATAAESAEPTDAPVSLPDQSIAEPTMMPMADQGCMGKAQVEVYGDPNAQQTQFQELFDAMSQLSTETEQDPQVKGALDA